MLPRKIDNDSMITWGVIVLWITTALASLALVGAIVWAIVTLVLHFT